MREASEKVYTREERFDIISKGKKGSCSKGGKCASEHDPAKKGKGQGTRSRSPTERDNSAERQYARETGITQSRKEDRLLSLNYKNRNYSHDRECDYGHPPHWKYFKK